MSREEAMHQDFDSMTDEDIALLAQQGDADASEYLLNKYKNFVRSKARSYFLVGADHEDIVQEGMIGLFKAFRDFRPDKLAESRMDEALSTLDRRVLASYLDGKSYQEIAQMLGRHVKSIDNALQRVKHKLEKLMEERGN